MTQIIILSPHFSCNFIAPLRFLRFIVDGILICSCSSVLSPFDPKNPTASSSAPRRRTAPEVEPMDSAAAFAAMFNRYPKIVNYWKPGSVMLKKAFLLLLTATVVRERQGLASRCSPNLLVAAVVCGRLRGLEFAAELGVQNFIIESDSREAVQLISSRQVIAHRHMGIILTCWKLLDEFGGEFKIQHTHRSGNVLADALAKASHELEVNDRIFHVLPVRFADILNREFSPINL